MPLQDGLVQDDLDSCPIADLASGAEGVRGLVRDRAAIQGIVGQIRPPKDKSTVTQAPKSPTAAAIEAAAGAESTRPYPIPLAPR